MVCVRSLRTIVGMKTRRSLHNPGVCRVSQAEEKSLGHELIDTLDDTNLIDGRLIDKPARNGAGEQVS